MVFDSLLLFYVAVFVCVLLLAEGIYYLIADRRSIQERRTINRRMQLISEGADLSVVLSKLRRKSPNELAGNAAALMSLAPVKKLEDILTGSGLSISTSRFLTYQALGFIFGYAFLFAVLKFSLFLALLLALLLAIVLPIYYVVSVRRKRNNHMGEQLPDVLDMIVRSLRAGHPISTAIKIVAQETPDPLGSEFGIVFDEMSFGLDLEQALRNMSERVQFDDMRFVIVSVQMQARTGGNLAEVLSALARLIRERQRFRLRVMTLSAEGRFSAKILAALPLVFVGLISLMSPNYFDAVSDNPTMATIIKLSIGMTAVGFYLMRRVVNFRI